MKKIVLNIMVVDDDPFKIMNVKKMIEDIGHKAYEANSGEAAIELCRIEPIDSAIIDYNMPQMNGIETGRRLLEINQSIILFMLTAYGIGHVEEALENGFNDYLTKPMDEQKLRILITKVIRIREKQIADAEFHKEYERLLTTKKTLLLGESNVIKNIKKQIETVAPTNTTVLIYGNTGTGKEIIANLINEKSRRDKLKFVAVNCGALTESLLESELFGHEKGAFTGAVNKQLGRFELADGGTIFLDEINSCSMNLQVKLLRVIQEREFYRVGGKQTINVDVRIIAVTNHNLQKEVEEGHFREDLFYRLNVFPIHVPDLSEHREDIPILARHFLTLYSNKMNKKITDFPEDAMRYLCERDWPGNIRELENFIERAVVLCENKTISMESIQDNIKKTENKINTPNTLSYAGNKDVERRLDLILAMRHVLNSFEDIMFNNDDVLRKELLKLNFIDLCLCESAKINLSNEEVLFNAVKLCQERKRVVADSIDILMGKKCGALKNWWKNNSHDVIAIVKNMNNKYGSIIYDLQKISPTHFGSAFIEK